MNFSLHKHHLSLFNQHTCLKKINLWPKALSCLLGTVLIQITPPKKPKNNSNVEISPTANAAYGSCCKIVAGSDLDIWKEWQKYRVLLAFKRTSQKEVEGQEIHLPAWWRLVKGQGQESSGCSVESTWYREYRGRWRSSLWCHPQADSGETVLGCRKGGWKGASPPLYHQIWN